MSNALPGLADPKHTAKNGAEALVLYGVQGCEVLLEPVRRRDLGRLQLLEVLVLMAKEMIRSEPFVSHSEVHEGQPVPLDLAKLPRENVGDPFNKLWRKKRPASRPRE